MNIIPTVYAAASGPADGANISNLQNPASKIPTSFSVSDLLTKGGVNLLNLVFIIIGLLFFANLVMAGWDYMLSSGDPKKISAATTRLLNSFIGIIMALTAFIVVRVITAMLGIGNAI